jgi:hypothetical protein
LRWPRIIIEGNCIEAGYDDGFIKAYRFLHHVSNSAFIMFHVEPVLLQLSELFSCRADADRKSVV